jgi:hypothetical protein
MLQLKNSTPFNAKITLLGNRRGVDTLYAIVKGTFTIGTSCRLAEEQIPVTLTDQYFGDPATTSIRVPSDVSLEKPGTDVLLSGSAWAPGGTPTWQVDAYIAVGPVAKTVRVFGDRVWEAGAAGAAMTWVAPFERMPLVWERAFGGSDLTDKGPVTEPRNPVGTGFRAPNGTKPLAGLPLPNVEDPLAPISSWKSAPAPAGFGAVSPHWMPRRTYAGTYDDAWQKHRAPYLPDDFDPHFCQIAPLGLSTAQPLQGGEIVDLRGVTPDGLLRFALPSVTADVVYRIDGGAETRPGVLDTLIIEPDAQRLVMVWRAALECDKNVLKVREVETTIRSAAEAVTP